MCRAEGESPHDNDHRGLPGALPSGWPPATGVFAAIGAPELIIEEIAAPSDTGFRPAKVLLGGRHTTVSIPTAEYLVASTEERDEILARESR